MTGAQDSAAALHSVIVTTYDKPRHLALALESLLHQRLPPLEIIVADDGSTADTAEVVHRFARRAPFRVEHVWQEHRGFRAAAVRNLGARAARGEYLVFLDGDCLPFRSFLAAHARSAGSRRVLAGDRMFLDEKPSATVTEEQISDGDVARLAPAAEHWRLRWRAAKSRVYQWTRLKDRPKVVTANLSLARRAFEDVNGLDERFVGWGHEDEDLRRRLVRRGYQLRSVATRARALHLWHPHVPSFRGKVRLGDNADYYHRGFFLSRCRHGLTTRPIRSLVIAWNGVPSEDGAAPEVSIAWGPRPRIVPAEVTIRIVDAAQPVLPARDAHIAFSLGTSAAAPTADGAITPGSVIEIPERLDLSDAAQRDRFLEYLEPVL